MATTTNDDAPVEVSLSASKNTAHRQIEQEQIHQQRHTKNAKKRKPKWAKSNNNSEKDMQELDATAFDEEDFKQDMDEEPLAKKQRLNKWMEESDLFYHVTESDAHAHTQQIASAIDEQQIEQATHTDSDEDDDVEDEEDEEEEEEEQVPPEVIALFERAMKESKTQKELEDKWRKIIAEQSKKHANLSHKLSKFDQVFVDGFQLEVNGVYRLNISALKRALRMKHFSTKKGHRMRFNKQMSYGSTQPSFAFIADGVRKKYDLRNKQLKPTSFWGLKLNHFEKSNKTDEDLQKWLEY